MDEAVAASASEAGQACGGRRPGEAPEGTVFMSRTKSFTRRARELPANLARTWEAHAHRYVVEPRRGVGYTTVAEDFTLDLEALFGRSAPVTLEIGSGTGEQIVAAAAANPQRDFLALEVWVPGIAKLMSKAVEADVDNIRVIEADAAQALPIMLGDASLDEVWSRMISLSRLHACCAMGECGAWPRTGTTTPGRCATSSRPASSLRTRTQESVRTRRTRGRSEEDSPRALRDASSRTLRPEASMRAATPTTLLACAARVADGSA